MDQENKNPQSLVLSHRDYIELAQGMTYCETEKNHVIYNHGDTPKNFYMIVSGSVSTNVKNEIIENWDWARSIYMRLIDWKQKEFDKKVQKELAL